MPMTDRHSSEPTGRARPPAAGTEPDLGVVVEYQRIEIKRVLKENQNLRGDIDRLLRLLERDQVIRQQEQRDRGAMLAVVERLATDRALPPPPETAASEAGEAGEAAAEAPPPDPGEEAAENDFETSLSDLQEICDRLESVRARAPEEAARTAAPAAPAESPDDTAPLFGSEDLAALLNRLDQLGRTEGESRSRRPAGSMADEEGPGSSEARVKRVLSRFAALFERRP